MKAKKLLCFILAGVLMMGACGCMPNNKVNENNEIRLTERQQNILASQGLPVEYAQLTKRQQLTITDIEEMLQAVEAKYNRPFAYVDYTAERVLDSGVLTAMPVGGTAARDSFTVERVGDNAFRDTYVFLPVRDKYEAAAWEAATAFVDAAQAKLYSDVLETDITYEEVATADLAGRVEADSWLFLNESAYRDADLTALSQSITGKLASEGLYGSLYIVVVKGDYFAAISQNGYTKFLADTYVVQRKFAVIAK